MEDDGPIADAFNMPGFISSFDEGRVKLSRNLPTETSFADGKVERSVGDLKHGVTSSNSRLSLDGAQKESGEWSGEEEDRDAEGNNNNNCNGRGERRRASAVEIFKRNFDVSKSSSPDVSVRSRMQCGDEHDYPDGIFNNDLIRRHGSGCGDGKKLEHETGDAVDKNEQTFSELPTSDVQGIEYLTVIRGCYHSYGSENTLDESFSAKEHAYCTVYCIANDRQINDGEITDRYDETTTADAPEMYSETGQDSGTSPEPTLYTLDDLVDPFGAMGRQLYIEQAGAESAMQSCRVCLEDKTIASLPCCRKAVCDECLKLYVSSQVGTESTEWKHSTIQRCHI